MQIHEITLKEAVGGAGAFGQIAQTLTKPITTTAPTQTTAPSTSSTGGTTTPTTTGLTHTANLDNPNPRATPPTKQQLWDREYRRLQSQFPGLTQQQYQDAMVKRMGGPRPAGSVETAPVATATPVATQTTTPAPAPAVTSTPATIKTYPPITLGTGPKAQVYINKGRGYVDSKTGKPMPPAIIKAMGL